jgi:hypothetical protein
VRKNSVKRKSELSSFIKIDPVLICIVVAAALSITGSLTVISTFLCFSRLRTKTFMNIIGFISIGDLIGNFPYLLPYRPRSGSWWCTGQALLNLTGYPIEWLWTVTLVYLLYLTAVEGKLPEKLWHIHLICWFLPAILSLLTLTVGRYSENYLSSQDVCVVNNSTISIQYHDATYYGLFLLCFIIMLSLMLRIYCQSYFQNEDTERSTAFKVAKRALFWYPLHLMS